MVTSAGSTRRSASQTGTTPGTARSTSARQRALASLTSDAVQSVRAGGNSGSSAASTCALRAWMRNSAP